MDDNMTATPNTPSDISLRVRRNAGSAALAAACLIYFGFFQLAKPVGNDLFAIASLVFVYTLQIGGVLMAMVVLPSLLGHPMALLLDAVVSVGIGVLFVLTGVAMLLGGGDAIQTVLNVIFGAMFFSAGVRNGRYYITTTSNPSNHE
jgi:hypothetical protein